MSIACGAVALALAVPFAGQAASAAAICSAPPVTACLHTPSSFAILNYIVKCYQGATLSIQETLKALSDPVRREILENLKSGRMSAGQIADLFPISAPAISRHLSVLKDAGLVRDYRQGKRIYYELKASVLEETLLWITNLKEQP